MVLIAVNRFIAVCLFSYHDSVFRINRTRLFVAAAWVFGILGGICQFFPGFGYSYMNGPDLNAPNNKYWLYFDRFVSASVVIILILCYTAIILKRKGTTRDASLNALDQQSRIRREKAERKLALQFGIIVLLLLLYICYLEAGEIDADLFYSYLPNLLFYLLYIAFIGFNPIIYLIFNADVRKHFLEMFCCKKQTAVVPIQQRRSTTTRHS
jgi:hypothetical protein